MHVVNSLSDKSLCPSRWSRPMEAPHEIWLRLVKRFQIRLKHNQGGHFSKSMLYVNTLLVLTPIIILLSELNSKFQMLSSDILYVQVVSIFKYFVHDQQSGLLQI